jgi:hypothetical protein
MAANVVAGALPPDVTAAEMGLVRDTIGKGNGNGNGNGNVWGRGILSSVKYRLEVLEAVFQSQTYRLLPIRQRRGD